jgi:predicted nucleic acid-binding protein
MSPKDIGESLIALSGSKTHLDSERKQRGDVLEQRRDRDDSLERAAERELEETVELEAIGNRDAARHALAEAEKCWDSYVVGQYQLVLKADTIAAEQIASLTEHYEEARDLAEAAANELKVLKEERNLAALERRAREDWDTARERTSKLREVRGGLSATAQDLTVERNDLRSKADGWDGRSSATAAEAKSKAERGLHRAEVEHDNAQLALDTARAAIKRAQEGRAGVAGLALDALARQEVDGAAIFDVLELDESVRGAWEPRLVHYEGAVVVHHSTITKARAALAGLPGATIIATDHQIGSFPEGVQCSWEITHFLRALEARLDHRHEPDSVHDAALSVTINGGFPTPITGRDALLAKLQDELDIAVQAIEATKVTLDLTRATVVLATNSHNCAVAAEQLKIVIERERLLSGKIAELDGKIRTATGLEEELQEAWEGTRDDLSGHTDKVKLVETQLEKLRADQRERNNRLSTRAKERTSLDVEAWRALAVACPPADEPDTQSTTELEARHLGALRVKATDHLASATRLFGIDESDDALPAEMKESIIRRQQLAAGTGSGAPQTSLREIAEPLRGRLDSTAGADRVTRTRIMEQREEHARVHAGLEEELRSAEQRLEVVQDMISRRVEGVLSRVSVAFGQLDTDRGGNGADLHFTPTPPQGAGEWIWEVTPRWKRSRSGGMVSYREIANGAQVKVYAVQLVLAAVLADAQTRGRVLVLDELGNSLGEVNRKDVLGALKRVAEDKGVTILGTCQDSVVVDAADVCGELLWFAHTSESEAYNRPTRVWGFTENGEQVELTAEHVLSGRRERRHDE